MAEILIRDPQHFYWLMDPEILNRARTKREIKRELAQTLRVIPGESAQLDYLRFVKRREMLHIGVRDLLRLCPVEETLAALSTLAEALITLAHWVCASHLRREYGIPKNVFTGFTVLGMGKLGGRELNFSSDVDLIYLYASDDEHVGSTSAAEYFRRLGSENHGRSERLHLRRLYVSRRPSAASRRQIRLPCLLPRWFRALLPIPACDLGTPGAA